MARARMINNVPVYGAVSQHVRGAEDAAKERQRRGMMSAIQALTMRVEDSAAAPSSSAEK